LVMSKIIYIIRFQAADLPPAEVTHDTRPCIDALFLMAFDLKPKG
jgi:hypothetical protein